MDDRPARLELLASGRRHLANARELIETSAELVARARSLRLARTGPRPGPTEPGPRRPGGAGGPPAPPTEA